MDYIARHGWDVYLIDVRGYGRSTRPPEMDQPAASNPPIVTTVSGNMLSVLPRTISLFQFCPILQTKI